MFLLAGVVCIWGFIIMGFLWLECEPHQDRAVFASGQVPDDQ